MTVTFSDSVFEFTGTSLFVRFAGREVFVERPQGQPLGFISRARSDADAELWGLGFHAVVSRDA